MLSCYIKCLVDDIIFTTRKRSCGKVMFLQLSLEQAPPRAVTPPSRPPRSRHPPEQTPPRADTPAPLHSACWEIRSTSGRYASYWNAILLSINFIYTKVEDLVANYVFIQSYLCIILVTYGLLISKGKIIMQTKTM